MVPLITIYLTIEFGFLIANVYRICRRRICYVDYRFHSYFCYDHLVFCQEELTQSYLKLAKLEDYKVLSELSDDLSDANMLPHLIYMTNAGRADEIEEKVMLHFYEKDQNEPIYIGLCDQYFKHSL